MKKYLLILACFLLIGGTAFAQQGRFANPITAPLYFNPAFAGSMDQLRVALSNRNQWIAIPGSSRIFYGAGDMVSNRLKGAVGAEFYHRTNLLGTHDLQSGLMYAAKINLGFNWTLSPALKVGYRHYVVDGYSLEPNVNPIPFRLVHQSLNFSPGVVLNSPSFYFGLSSGSLGSIRLSQNQELRENDPIPRPLRNYTLQTGYRFQPSGPRWSLAASGLFQLSGISKDIQGQVMLNRKWLLLGIGGGYYVENEFFRNTSFAFTFGYKHRRFRLLAGYDYRISGLTNYPSGGSWEFSLMLYLPGKTGAGSPESSEI